MRAGPDAVLEYTKERLKNEDPNTAFVTASGHRAVGTAFVGKVPYPRPPLSYAALIFFPLCLCALGMGRRTATTS